MEEIAKVYARSLFEVAREQGQFVDALNQHRELAIFFFSPYFSVKEKEEALGRVLVDAEPILLNFLSLLIEKHRMPVIFRIRDAFEQMWEQENRMLPVEITSAIELDADTLEQLSQEISERTGRKVKLATRVDPEILGGLVVRVGNSILDASIRNRLEQLRRHVAQGAS
jgi:ATP synthase F1 delta subunit